MTAGTIVRFKRTVHVPSRPMRYNPPIHNYETFMVEQDTPAIVRAGGRDPKGCVLVKLIGYETPIWAPENDLEVMGHVGTVLP